MKTKTTTSGPSVMFPDCLLSRQNIPKNLKVTHRSLFDQSLQGVERTDCPAFSFQGHPEASPGPHDVAPLFHHFIELMQQRRSEA